MKKLNLKNLNLEPSDLLQREQLKIIIGGNNDGYGSSVSCKCTYDTGNAQGPETSCESCFSYCEQTYGSRLKSTLCVGG